MICKIDPQNKSPYLKDASNFSGGSADKVIIPESSDELINFLRKTYHDNGLESNFGYPLSVPDTYMAT